MRIKVAAGIVADDQAVALRDRGQIVGEHLVPEREEHLDIRLIEVCGAECAEQIARRKEVIDYEARRVSADRAIQRGDVVAVA